MSMNKPKPRRKTAPKKPAAKPVDVETMVAMVLETVEKPEPEENYADGKSISSVFPNRGETVEKPEQETVYLAYTAMHAMWTNAMRYIETKGRNIPTGFVIPRNMWLRVKRILGKQFADLTAEDTDFITRMMDGIK